jgi:SNF2-related domain/Hint-domain
MLTVSQLHDYQKRAVEFQCSHPETALWLDPGLGKTATTLTSINHLIGCNYLCGVLVVAPIRVCRLVWAQEAKKWQHLQNLKFMLMTGTRDQRTRALIKTGTNVWIVNYENLGWLAETLHTYFISKGLPLPFDGLVWDEISKCFPAGTPITTENSTIAIDKLKIGDKVMTHLGLRSVVDVLRNQSVDMVSIYLANGTTLQCTSDHPILLNEKWVAAGNLVKGDMLYGTLNTPIWSRGLRNLWSHLLETKRRTIHLFKTLFGRTEDARSLDKRTDHKRGDQGSPETSRCSRYMEQGSALVRRNAYQDERESQEAKSLSSDRWEWNWWVMGRELIANCVTRTLRSGVYIQDAISSTGIPDTLQDRLRRSTEQDRNRGTGGYSYHEIGETKGLEKTRVLGKIRVEGVVHHKRTSSVDVWNITVEEAETYFAGGILVHNCKNSTTQRVKSVRKILPHFKWKTGLTGSPASNGYKDLHGQFLVLDEGKRLGTSKTAFRTRFYRKEGPYKEVPFEDTETTIKNLIGDMTIEMGATDYLKMPDLIVNDVWVELDPTSRARYDKMEKEFFIRLDSGAEKEMFNQASLMNSCLQFSNGAIYPIAGMPLWEPIHALKLDALEDIIEEAGGNPVLCWYAYRSDAARIMERFKDLNPINLTECKSQHALDVAMHRWKTGDCQLMISHPLSAGHGIDGLQAAGHTMVWFGLTWSLDSYDQAIARLHRQGQGRPVICHRILTTDTLDQAQADALNGKAADQISLRRAVSEYRKNKSKSS